MPGSRLPVKQQQWQKLNAAKIRQTPQAPTPKIDFTPMVDLGFLLITFFVYTTTLANPRTMELNMPVDPPPGQHPQEWCEECTITLIPTVQHKIIYYEGALNNEQQLHTTTFSPNNAIRGILLTKQDELKHLPEKFSFYAHKLHVLIKPANDCTYDDVVKVLDEMMVLDVPFYAMTDISATEKELLEKKFKHFYGK